MDDRIIYCHKNVAVSNDHFIIDQKYHLIEHIASVQSVMIKPKCIFARLLMFGGLPCLFLSGFFPALGLVAMLAGFVLYKTAKVRYAIIIQTPNGFEQAFISEEILAVENAESAINIAPANKRDKHSY